jgi:transcriptional regulator NrdR family protein
MPLLPGHNRKRGGASFPCPKCGRPSHVRWTKLGNRTVVRERECLVKRCGTRFTTHEKEPVDAE